MSNETIKKAIVFDTNFIIEHISDLEKIVEELSSLDFNIYVTEISINERLSQKFLELKKNYEEIEKFKNDYSKYVKITLKKSFEERFENDKKFTLNGYEKLFGDNIIPFKPSEEVLKIVMDRVFKKIPPFKDAKNASDKGFKDTLLWMSLQEYFKNKHNISVMFITNDKGFVDNIDSLKQEFNSYTGIEIEIKNNSYYSEILDEEKEDIIDDISVASEKDSIKRVNNCAVSELREQILTVINDLMYTEDMFGDTVRTFSTNTYFENEILQSAFEDLNNVIGNHILESAIRPSLVWGDKFLIDDKTNIPMEKVEDALELYKTIKSKYSEYMIPFLNAVCEIINKNYVKPYDPDDMPF